MKYVSHEKLFDVVGTKRFVGVKTRWQLLATKLTEEKALRFEKTHRKRFDLTVIIYHPGGVNMTKKN